MKSILIIIALTACSWGFARVLEARDTQEKYAQTECAWGVLRAWRDHAYSDKQANRLLVKCGSKHGFSLLEK